MGKNRRRYLWAQWSWLFIAHWLLTKWTKVDKLDNITSGNRVSYTKSQFSRHGLPDEMASDKGPQFASSEFSRFVKSYEFVHTTWSPHYPQANGEVKRAVNTVKALLKKGTDPYWALFNYRNMPLEPTNLSPAQLLMGHRLKTILPTNTALLKPPGLSEIKCSGRKAKRKKNSNMTSIAVDSYHHFTLIMLSECTMVNSGKLQ